MPITNVLLRFDKYLHSTERAFLIRIGNDEHWLPKKLCRRFTTNKKLGGNVIIPTFIYERITGELPIESDAETIIEKHVPIRKQPIDILPDAELTR
jgi:hypothetical protein